MYKITFIYTQDLKSSRTKYYTSYSSFTGLLRTLEPSRTVEEIEALVIGVIDSKLSVIQVTLHNVELTLVIEKLPERFIKVMSSFRVAQVTGAILVVLLIAVLALIAMIFVPSVILI